MDDTDDRSTRLAAALAAIGALDPVVKPCPNPDLVDVRFAISGYEDGLPMFGAGFDIANANRRHFEAHGFQVHLHVADRTTMDVCLRDVAGMTPVDMVRSKESRTVTLRIPA